MPNEIDLGGLTVEDIDRETRAIMGIPGIDPMRPHDIVAPPGLYTNPPICNACPDGVFLHPVNTNSHGDVHLECLSCGFDCVWRAATKAFEPFPDRVVPADWKPPTLKFNRKPVSAQSTRTPVTDSEGDMDGAMCSPREAATRLGIDVATIGSYLADGRLTFKTIEGRKIRIPVSEIEALRKRGGDIDRG